MSNFCTVFFFFSNMINPVTFILPCRITFLFLFFHFSEKHGNFGIRTVINFPFKEKINFFNSVHINRSKNILNIELQIERSLFILYHKYKNYSYAWGKRHMSRLYFWITSGITLLIGIRFNEITSISGFILELFPFHGGD